MNVPTVLVVFGTTGDLMTRKILAALAYLSMSERLPDHFRVIGWGRRGWDDAQLRAHVASILDAYEGIKPEGEAREDFISRFVYHDGQFDDEEAYQALAARLF